ncbi:hypothetical protein D3C79_933800 [compost metagenome]
MDRPLEMKLQQLLQKGRCIILFLLRQIADIIFGKAQVTDVLGNALQTRKHGKAVPERQLAEVDFEYCFAFMCSVHPVGVHHIDLVFICM